MFVRCIMKLHACIKFLSYLLSINYFMFVSFVVFGCYTADDNGGKCVYMFVLYDALSADIQNRQLFFPTFSLILYSSHEYTIAQGPFHLITTHKWKLLYKVESWLSLPTII